ncbi:MAG: outer membrane beta-barrel protein, partial [Ignavibacteria bacterium]
SLAPGYYLGGSLGFTTTGGRNAVSDYSGEIKVDEIINGYNLGLLFEHNLIQNFYLTAQLYFIYSTMRVEEIVKLNDLSSSHSSKFNSIGIGIEPGFSYAVLDNPLIVRINIGLHVGFSTDFHMDDEADEILEGIHPGWSGFRASLQAGYPF